MKSNERKQARFERRQADRMSRKEQHSARYDSFENVADPDALYAAFLECRKGVSWKASVQRYEARILCNIAETCRNLREGKSIQPGFVTFDVHERGRIRHIKSVHISERVVQKCLCDNVLAPLLTRSLIYDNGASLAGKGVRFALSRLKTHISRFYRNNASSNTGYVLTIDFSKYFDNIRHDVLLNMIARYSSDPELFALIKSFITVFENNTSLGLGSQISQIGAVSYLNRLDHYIKERLRVRYYGRYMDDLYLIHKDKAYLRECLENIKTLCDELGMVINPKKTRIESLAHGFIFLQGRYAVTETGKILCRPRKQSVLRMRRRLKKLIRLEQAGTITGKDVYQSYQSWRNTFQKRFNAYQVVKRMDILYNTLILKGAFYGLHWNKSEWRTGSPHVT
jgi:hypothetical protein